MKISERCSCGANLVMEDIPTYHQGEIPSHFRELQKQWRENHRHEAIYIGDLPPTLPPDCNIGMTPWWMRHTWTTNGTETPDWVKEAQVHG